MLNQKPHAKGPDPARSRLRATVAKMDRELAALKTAAKADPDGKGLHDALFASFDDLVDQLALGPEPEVRECPKCGGIGMRVATVCGTCWTKLTPPQIPSP
jgi:hypothetical protein